MKLTIKTLKQVSYQVDIEDANISVLQLKNIIENKHNFDAKSIKLLFNSQILDDNKKLVEYAIADGIVIVMMSAKAKPQNVNMVQANTQEEKKQNEEVKPENKNSNLNNQGSTSKKAEKKQPKVKDYTNEMKQLADMGFSNDLSSKAIAAANGDINLAIEFLYNGIPSNNQQGNQVPIYSDLYGEDEEYNEDEEFLLDPEMLNRLDLKDPNSLKTIASVLKVLINEDPSQLEVILSDIEETNPEIIEFIKSKETEFKALIQEPITQGDLNTFSTLAPRRHHHDDEEEGDELEEGIEDVINNQITNQQTSSNPISNLNLTQNEKEAIERLKGLGFQEVDVIQAYIACDKNEELTANFLFENKYNDMNVDGKIIKFNI